MLFRSAEEATQVKRIEDGEAVEEIGLAAVFANPTVARLARLVDRPGEGGIADAEAEGEGKKAFADETSSPTAGRRFTRAR